MKRVVAMVAALLLVLAACSDDDDGGFSISADEDTSSTDDSTSGESEESSDTESSDDEPPPEESSDDESASSASSAGSGSDSEFCASAATVDETFDAFSGDTIPNPDELRAQVEEAEDAIERARDVAPPEIREEIDKSAEAFGLLKDALDDADYDFLNVNVAALEAADDPMFEEADATLDQYLFDVCGIGDDPGSLDEPGAETTEPADDGDVDIGDEGTVRDAVEEGFIQSGFTQQEAECLASQLTLDDLANADDPSQLLAIFESCGISLDRLAELGGG